MPVEVLCLPKRSEPVQSPPQKTNISAPKARMSEDCLPKELQMENKLLKELLEAKNKIPRMKEAEIGRL